MRRPFRFSILAGLVITPILLTGCTKDGSGAAPTGTPAASARSSAPASSPSVSTAASSSASVSSDAADTSDPQALDDLGDQVTKEAKLDTSSDQPDYASYERVAHPVGEFSFEVPTEWTEENISDTDPIIQRAPDLDAYLQKYKTGIEARRYTDASAESMLKDTAPGCTPGPVRPYDDGRFKGVVQVFTDCADNGNAVVVSVVSTADDGAFRAYFNSSYIDTRDVAALKRIIASVQYE